MKKLIIFPIRLYQWLISPMLGEHCRFYPSCSEYAVGAIEKHGLLRGICKMALRICKCGPWHPGGCDIP